MIDRSTPANSHTAALPAFKPVPRQTKRHDGWTPDRQRRFIAALADLGSVKAAALAVNMAAEGAYQLRRHPQAAGFREAWSAALALGVQRLEDIAMDRALNGVEVPVYCYGNLIGTRRVYNDALLMFMLRNRAPIRFAADSLTNASASTHSQLDRLKREWRQQWEEEQAAERAKSSAEVVQSLNARLEKMQQRRLALMNPRTRELLNQYHDAEAEDKANGYLPDYSDEEEDDE